MAPDHGHDHSAHAGHAHTVSADADRSKLTIALALILGFMAVEVVVGIIANSLALLSDAAHMLTDAGALVLALVAISLAARPARGALTFGWQRAGILSAQFNGATLLVLGLLIVYEGIRRLIDPPAVEGGVVFAVALLGIVVNLRRDLDALEGEPRLAQRRGRLPAHPHRPRRLRLHRDRRARHPDHRLRPGRRDRLADRRRDHAPRRLRPAPGIGPRLPRGRAARARPGRDRQRDGRRSRASSRSTTCTSGRSPRASRRSPRTSSSTPTTDCHAIRLALEHEIHERFAIDHTTLQVEHRHPEELLQVEVASDSEPDS